MSVVSDVHREDWEDRQDVARAVRSATALYTAVSEGIVDPVASIEVLEIAAEPLWDGPGGDVDLVYRVARDMQAAFAAEERRRINLGELQTTDPERIGLRVRPMMLLARAEYRRPGRERDSFATLLAIVTWIEDFVDGRRALEAILRHDRNSVAEATVAILGLWPAALRMAALPRPLHEQYRIKIVALISAYLGDDGPRVVYPRTAALAIQTLKLCVADRRAGENALVRLVYELDVRTRPQHDRGQSTRAVRDAAYAEYCKDESGKRRALHAASSEVEAFGLPRHQDLMKRLGYLAA